MPDKLIYKTSNKVLFSKEGVATHPLRLIYYTVLVTDKVNGVSVRHYDDQTT